MCTRLYDQVLRDAIRARHGDMSGFLAECKASPEKLEALDFWDAKECLHVTRAWGGEITAVDVLPNGITWFADRHKERVDFWREHIVKFLGGFIAGVLTTLLAEWLLRLM